MSLVTQISSKELETDRYIIRGKTKVKDPFGNYAVSFKLFFKEKDTDIFLASNIFQIKKTTDIKEITNEMCVLFSLEYLRTNYVN